MRAESAWRNDAVNTSYSGEVLNGILNEAAAGVEVVLGVADWAGGKSATEHLLQLGHRCSAHLGGPEEVRMQPNTLP
jgi:hypothetical protein